MINSLYEFQNREAFSGSKESYLGLEEFLDEIWRKREKSDYYAEEDNTRIEVQQFIQFIHKTKELKSNKYVGVINFEGHKINLLPKIFYNPSRDPEKDFPAIQSHILWWLSYCRKIKFPNYQTSLGSSKSDFFEILIYLFSKYTNELLSNSVYQQYEEVSSELSFIKGRLNTSEYLTENLSKGRWHKLNCTYDSFVFDNSFNRIIKYVTRMLYNATADVNNKRHLREILFILDEVSDVRVSAHDCLKIKFNPLFSELETVRDYCHLFLNNSISLDYKNDLKLFAFLLPMEYLFEDFIFGFIDKEIDGVKAQSQTRSTYLDEAKNFSLKPDLYLQVGDRNIIADTKYKIIYGDDNDPKKGISQSDLYQMLAYGIRHNINEIKLLYPDTIDMYRSEESQIVVRDELADGSEICIDSYQLPIINRELFDLPMPYDVALTKAFEKTKKALIARIGTMLDIGKDRPK